MTIPGSTVPSLSYFRKMPKNQIIGPSALLSIMLLLSNQSILAIASDETTKLEVLGNNSANNLTQLHEREFVSPHARIQMDCQRDKTLIKVNFTRPFNGIMGAGNLETTKCKLIGANGGYYELQVNHNATEECDARWDNSTSSIANTLFIRFHQSLETGADIAKNMLCRLSVGDLVVGRRPSNTQKAKKQQIIKAKRNP